MDKPASHHVRRPRLQRVPAQEADYPPQVTAQPRTLPDDIAAALEDDDEELSVAPEDLGARFLSEAIEQGDFDPERATVREVSLFEQTDFQSEVEPSEDAAPTWDERAAPPSRAASAETEHPRSHQRQSGFAPAGTHAGTRRRGPTQLVLRFAAAALRKLAERLQPSAAKRR